MTRNYWLRWQELHYSKEGYNSSVGGTYGLEGRGSVESRGVAGAVASAVKPF